MLQLIPIITLLYIKINEKHVKDEYINGDIIKSDCVDYKAMVVDYMNWYP